MMIGKKPLFDPSKWVQVHEATQENFVSHTKDDMLLLVLVNGRWRTAYAYPCMSDPNDFDNFLLDSIDGEIHPEDVTHFIIPPEIRQ